MSSRDLVLRGETFVTARSKRFQAVSSGEGPARFKMLCYAKEGPEEGRFQREISLCWNEDCGDVTDLVHRTEIISFGAEKMAARGHAAAGQSVSRADVPPACAAPASRAD